MKKENKKYHIITIGCQMNKSDSERIAAYLEKYGLEASQKRTKADFIILTTCGVRQSAEDRIYGLIPKIKKENKKAKIILTGCLSQRKDVIKRLKNKVDVWLSIADLSQLASKLSLKKEKTHRNYLNINPKYNSKISAFVPIGNGCDNFCAYCVVPYARGREIYRPAGEIINEVKSLVARGYKEINLIAQNVNSYKSPASKSLKAFSDLDVEKKINFSKLLKLINDIPGDFWIRFSTSHPKDMSDELINTIAKCKKVCNHIHLPAQSGDDKILAAMNRKYSKKHYLGLIKKIRKIMPNAAISTDIIVGFPGETKKQFNETKKLFKDAKFDLAYISQYSPRPETVAYRLKDSVSKKEKKRREEELVTILQKTAFENNKKYIGKVVDVLIEGKSKNGNYFGKTETYKMVKLIEYATKKRKNRRTEEKLNLKKSPLFIGGGRGRFYTIKITKAKDFGLEGEAI